MSWTSLCPWCRDTWTFTGTRSSWESTTDSEGTRTETSISSVTPPIGFRTETRWSTLSWTRKSQSTIHLKSSYTRRCSLILLRSIETSGSALTSLISHSLRWAGWASHNRLLFRTSFHSLLKWTGLFLTASTRQLKSGWRIHSESDLRRRRLKPTLRSTLSQNSHLMSQTSTFSRWLSATSRCWTVLFQRTKE